jgi:hypothetical protein
VADFVLKSLRGGLNNSDPAISLPDDQCTLATNVEFNKSMLGERRRGTSAITLPSSVSGKDRVTFLFRHLPTSDETAAQLWVLGVTGTASYQLAYKDTTWHDVTVSETVSLAGFDQYRWQAITLHGKLFVAFNHNLDRLHVWDGTSFRLVGHTAPTAAPTASDTGSGTFAGTRYYRVREATLSGSTVLRRSEPGPVLTKAPSGSGTGLVVTKPADMSENATHWELEASSDNVNFYRIARTVVGTTTATDSQSIVVGYAQGVGFVLSEDIGDYTLIGSARYLTTDADRLVWAGNYEDEALGSRVGWTPVRNADGVGNDERTELDTDPTLDLNGYEGGSITGLSSTNGGSFFATKVSHIYKLVRTGGRSAAYDVVTISKDRGGLHGSLISGVDQLGRPCIYFLDSNVGPCRYGANGLEWCGSDIRESWALVNLDATKAVCSGLYDPVTRQVQWAIATSSANVPNFGITVQTDAMRSGEDGTHKGWTTWDGTRTAALAQCLFSDNIDAGVARNRVLRPFIAIEGSGLVHRCDTGTTDNGTSYSARIVTKPYVLSSILNKMGVMAGALLAKAVSGATLTLKIIRDFGLETYTLAGVSTAPTASETQVVKILDSFRMSEARTVQFEFVDDAPSTTTRWELQQLALKERQEQTS